MGEKITRPVIVCRSKDVGYIEMCSQLARLRKDNSPEAAALRKKLGISRRKKAKD